MRWWLAYLTSFMAAAARLRVYVQVIGAYFLVLVEQCVVRRPVDEIVVVVAGWRELEVEKF